MILRVALAVVLTTALLAAVTPAVANAGAERADGAVDRQLAALAAELETMVATDDPTADPGARHVVELRLPGRSLTSAAVTRLRFTSRGGVALATWRVGDGATRSSTRLAGVPVHAAGGGALTLRESGTHRLAFELRSQDGQRVLTVSRLGGEHGA
ncbi:DUF7311 family protein [Haloarcula onubensis]|uniref:DUF7311 domain-containing protein n=1 Tax=Haloarcula onubensis TaxID=2950539 RepID=A0ABU2FLP2_9EURY|nr:hypothetical protein [Halomicroarcula sp. S3CR25-11]MDS0281152.1 hypothetical protein [Halomicroarcula sp. S3CR25-11]